MKAIEEIKNDLQGISLLHDWLGAGGKPVHQMFAEYRAHRCVAGDNGSPCPMNKAPKWWEKSKEIVADFIRRELEIKNSLELRVSCEADLHMCKVCGCALPLAVWVPIKHKAEHTSDEQLSQFPSWCWQLNEIKTL